MDAGRWQLVLSGPDMNLTFVSRSLIYWITKGTNAKNNKINQKCQHTFVSNNFWLLLLLFSYILITNNSKKALFLGLLSVFQLKTEPGPPIKPRKGKKVKKNKKKDNPSSITWGLVKITASLWRVGCGRCSIWWIKDLLFSAKGLLARRRKNGFSVMLGQGGGHHLEPFWFWSWCKGMGAWRGEQGYSERVQKMMM